METVVVTGGSGGIGAGLCRHLSGLGYRVINLDRQPPAAHETDSAEFVEVDLADGTRLRDTLDRVICSHRPTRLVANAAAGRPADFLATTLDDFDLTMAVNVRAALLCSQAMVPTMREHGSGRIVVISSRAALGKVDRTAYATSKAALHGMVRTMALELGRDGITANAIAPGPIDTPAFRRANPEGTAARARIEAGTAVGRMGTPADIANAVAFLLDEASGFITGQVLYVCGGLSVGIAR
jgi:NAD(P)-dependent dehydrogenase (short-subunit alcohol dehydrogenase family)